MSIDCGSYKSERPINTSGIDKIHLIYDSIDGSIVNGTRELILYRFALDKPPGHKIFNQPRVKLFKKLKKSTLSHFTFCLEDDDFKSVAFHNDTMSFTCQLIKI